MENPTPLFKRKAVFAAEWIASASREKSVVLGEGGDVRNGFASHVDSRLGSDLYLLGYPSATGYLLADVAGLASFTGWSSSRLENTQDPNMKQIWKELHLAVGLAAVLVSRDASLGVLADTQAALLWGGETEDAIEEVCPLVIDPDEVPDVPEDFPGWPRGWEKKFHWVADSVARNTKSAKRFFNFFAQMSEDKPEIGKEVSWVVSECAGTASNAALFSEAIRSKWHALPASKEHPLPAHDIYSMIDECLSEADKDPLPLVFTEEETAGSDGIWGSDQIEDSLAEEFAQCLRSPLRENSATQDIEPPLLTFHVLNDTGVMAGNPDMDSMGAASVSAMCSSLFNSLRVLCVSALTVPIYISENYEGSKEALETQREAFAVLASAAGQSINTEISAVGTCAARGLGAMFKKEGMPVGEINELSEAARNEISDISEVERIPDLMFFSSEDDTGEIPSVSPLISYGMLGTSSSLKTAFHTAYLSSASLHYWNEHDIKTMLMSGSTPEALLHFTAASMHWAGLTADYWHNHWLAQNK